MIFTNIFIKHEKKYHFDKYIYKKMHTFLETSTKIIHINN